MCYDVKYDAWVIERYSAGILPIVDVEPNTGTFSIPVSVISQPSVTISSSEESPVYTQAVEPSV